MFMLTLGLVMPRATSAFVVVNVVVAIDVDVVAVVVAASAVIVVVIGVVSIVGGPCCDGELALCLCLFSICDLHKHTQS